MSKHSTSNIALIWKQSYKHNHEEEGSKRNHKHENFLEKAHNNTLLAFLNFVDLLTCFLNVYILFQRDLFDYSFVLRKLSLEIICEFFHSSGHLNHFIFNLLFFFLLLSLLLIKVYFTKS